MNYIIYYPDNLNLSEKNPLVIYLHGLGEFGGDIQNTLAPSSYFTNNMRQGKFQQKAIFLAPQCSSSQKKWIDCFDNLKGLIDSVIQQYNVDTKRISMTGHSLGGQGVFDFIVTYPGFLAAAAPLAPSKINQDYSKMKDLKIAVFTGTKDNLFKPNTTDTTYLIEHGVNLKFYPLQDVSHSSQNKLFNGTNVIDWLISQSK
jgi:predicted peptidase